MIATRKDLRVTRKWPVLLSDLVFDAFVDRTLIPKYYGVGDENFVLKLGRINDVWEYGESGESGGLVRLGELLFDKEKTNPGHTMNVLERFEEVGETLQQEAYDFGVAIGPDSVWEGDIREKTFGYLDRLSEFMISLMAFGFQIPMEERLREILKGRSTIEEDLGILSFPKKQNASVLERKSFLAIASSISERGVQIDDFDKLPEDIQMAIREHVHNFDWISFRGGIEETLTVEDVLSRLRTSDLSQARSELDGLNNHDREIQTKFDELIRELKLSDEDENIVEIAKELVYFRTFRTDYANRIFGYLKPALMVLARHRGITLDTLLLYRLRELKADVMLDDATLERRRLGTAFVYDTIDEVKFTDDQEEVSKWGRRWLGEDDIAGVTEVKGSPAYLGKVVGKVRVLRGKEDIEKVQRGEVLVAPMTTPNMISAMERAVAFVTDEGGITCHAAIIAREMKKPCVIGTRNATQVFQDGDTVEVDADKGVVRKVK